MSDWAALGAELAQWRAAGLTATLWWRDDDAADATPEALRLIELARASAMPLSVAVVPAGLTAALADALRRAPDAVQVVQHGYAHINHASGADKKIELGPHRPAQIVIGEIATGKLALENALPDRLVPVLVPPWNRIAPYLVPTLPEMGYVGISQYGVRKREAPVPGLKQVNCHLDLIDWRGRRGFVGDSQALATLSRHLRLRRESWTTQKAIAGEPTGVMSHHAVHDPAAWDFLARLFDATRAHAKWLSARQVFAS